MHGRNPILIVDDSEDEAIFIARSFEKSGFLNPVVFLRNGQDAIDYLQGNGLYKDRSKYPFPRFLIIDLKMPGINGFEVLAWLQQHVECQIIPTIVYSNSKNPGDVKKAYQLGANAYFCKPNNLATLDGMLKIINEFWSLAEIPDLPAKC